MRSIFALPTALLAALCVCLALLPAAYGNASYFFVTNPTTGTQWVNGQTHLITWQKGLLDDVNYFDIELARLSTDGLIYIARDVAAATKGRMLNIQIADIPPANDYFLLFLNVTHGVTYSVSDRFTIAGAGAAPSVAPAPSPSATVVTVSGSPNPTVGFAVTFPADANDALPTWDNARAHGLGLAAVVSLAALAGAWVVL